MTNKKTITLRTLEKWAEKQEKLPSNTSLSWTDGYDTALADLHIQILSWRNRKQWERC